jgi:hypothetical protein
MRPACSAARSAGAACFPPAPRLSGMILVVSPLTFRTFRSAARCPSGGMAESTNVSRAMSQPPRTTGGGTAQSASSKAPSGVTARGVVDATGVPGAAGTAAEPASGLALCTGNAPCGAESALLLWRLSVAETSFGAAVAGGGAAALLLPSTVKLSVIVGEAPRPICSDRPRQGPLPPAAEAGECGRGGAPDTTSHRKRQNASAGRGGGQPPAGAPAPVPAPPVLFPTPTPPAVAIEITSAPALPPSAAAASPDFAPAAAFEVARPADLPPSLSALPARATAPEMYLSAARLKSEA